MRVRGRGFRYGRRVNLEVWIIKRGTASLELVGLLVMKSYVLNILKKAELNNYYKKIID
jgi:hypothetical protein